MEPISFLLIWVLGVFALQGPDNFVILLEEPDGTVGQVQISNVGGSQIMNVAGTVVGVANQQSAPLAPSSISDAAIREIFSDALDIAPEPPQSFQLYFKSGTAELTDESAAAVPDIIAAFRARDIPNAAVIGHTDTVGGADGNYRLALRRARVMRDQLIDAGMEEDKVSATSHGERDPVVKTPDNTPEEKNRRVEVTLW